MGARQSRLAKRPGEKTQKSASSSSGGGVGVSPADQKPTHSYNFVITDYIVENGGSESPLFKARQTHPGYQNGPGNVAVVGVLGNGLGKSGRAKDAKILPPQRPLPQPPTLPPPPQYADKDAGILVGQRCQYNAAGRTQPAKRSQSSAAAVQNRSCPVHGNYGLSPRRQCIQQQQQLVRQLAKQPLPNNFAPIMSKAEEEDASSAMDLEVDAIIEQGGAGPVGTEAAVCGGETLMRGRRGAPPLPELDLLQQQQHQTLMRQKQQQHFQQQELQSQLQQRQKLLQQQRLMHHHQLQILKQQQQRLQQQQLLQQQQQLQHQRQGQQQQNLQKQQELQQQQQRDRLFTDSQAQQSHWNPNDPASLEPQQSSEQKPEKVLAAQTAAGTTPAQAPSRSRPTTRSAVPAQSEGRPQAPSMRDDACQTITPASMTNAKTVDRESSDSPRQIRITLRRSRSRSQRARDVPRMRLLPAVSQAAAAASGRRHRVIDSNPTVLYRPRYYAQRRSLVEGLERLHMFCDDDDECGDNIGDNDYIGADGIFEHQRRPRVRRDSCPGKLNGENQPIQFPPRDHHRQERRPQEFEFDNQPPSSQPRRIADVRHAAELRRRCRTFSAMRGQPRDGPAPKSPLPAERRAAGQRAFYFFHIRAGGSLAQSEAFLFDPVVKSLASRHSCTLRLLPPEEAEDLPDGLRRVEVAGARLRDVKRFLYYLTTSEETVSLQKQIQERHTLSRRLSRGAADSRSQTTASSSPSTGGCGANGRGGSEARSHRDLLYLSSSAFGWSGTATPDTVSSAGGSQQRLWRANSEAMRTICDYSFMPSGYV